MPELRSDKMRWILAGYCILVVLPRRAQNDE